MLSFFALGLVTVSQLASGDVESEEVFVFSQSMDQDSLNLLSDGTVPSLHSKTKSYFLGRGLSKRIRMENVEKAPNLVGRELIESLEYQFSIDGIPLCQYQLKSHQTLNGSVAMFGKVPGFDVERTYTLEDWPARATVLEMVAETLNSHGLTGKFTETKSSACLWSDNLQLYPVYIFEVKAEGLNYTVVADELRSYHFQPKYFHATGKAAIYPNNVLDGAVQDFPLNDLRATGYLENDYFITYVESPFQRAMSSSFDFTFDPASQLAQFHETSLFTNANRTLQWLQSMGYKNFGSRPIRIVAHAEFQGDTNNALYQPGTDVDSILVGDGDGTVLQNLATDADVVGHELAHHVVYHSVTEIQGESLVLHEALADYFNFARAGNTCLGESICPDTAFGNKICYVPRKCLRTADNTLTMTSSDLPAAPHQRGQVISGMLWDLYAKDGLILKDVTQLVLSSIDLLVRNSGYKHFVVGLMMSDQALFQGKNCEAILDRAKARGFSSYLGDVSCETTALVIGDKVTAAFPEPTSPVKTSAGSKSRTSPRPTCGVLVGPTGPGAGSPWAPYLFLLPVILVFMRRPS
jgi:hypothetical protein